MYDQANEYLSKKLYEIEKWLDGLPTHPQVQYRQSFIPGSIPSRISGIHPSVVDTVDKVALLVEWRTVRKEAEWWKHISKELDF